MKRIKILVFTAIVSLGLALGTNAAVKNSRVPAQIKAPVAVQKSVTVYEKANPLDIVANPQKYLNKGVTIRAQFDKFTTLGLDYTPAFKSSEKYIGFLIKREDVINRVVPLSELKNFLLREDAEKYIDLKPGDMIEYSGVVFSNALGDAWISVDKFSVLSQQEKSKK